MTTDSLKHYLESIGFKISSNVFIRKHRVFIEKLKEDPKFDEEYNIHNALSNKKRFLIYKILEQHPMCTCALAKIFDTTDGAITHHLKILEKAGLIIGKKAGYFTSYYTKESLMKHISE